VDSAGAGGGTFSAAEDIRGTPQPGDSFGPLPLFTEWMVVDRSGDGRLDVIIMTTEGGENRLVLIEQSQAGPFTVNDTHGLNASANLDFSTALSSLNAADLDGDGVTDLVVLSNGSARVLLPQLDTWLRGRSSPPLSPSIAAAPRCAWRTSTATASLILWRSRPGTCRSG